MSSMPSRIGKHNSKQRLLKCLHCEANESHNKHKRPQDKIYMLVNRDLNACKCLELMHTLKNTSGPRAIIYILLKPLVKILLKF